MSAVFTATTGTLAFLAEVFAISYLVLRKTSFDLRVYAVGGHRTAADLAGVRSRQILTSVYEISRCR